MLQYEELRLRLINHEKTLDDLSEALGLDKMKEEIAQLEKEQTVDGFWDDIANSQKVVQRTSNLKSKVAAYEKLRQDYDDALVMIELSNEEEDEGMLDECTESVEKFESDLDTMTLTTLLSGEYDAQKCNSYLPRRCRRNRGAGLGADAFQNVLPMGRASRL